MPDLRSGAGFTILIWLNLNILSSHLTLLDGMSRVSGSLGEIFRKEKLFVFCVR